MRFIVVGGKGRMGRVVVEMAMEQGIEAVVVDPEDEIKDINQVSLSVDCVVDFSSPQGTREAVDFCVERKLPLVSGTTGFDPDAMFKEASKEIPILYAPNFSPGVNLLFFLMKSIPQAIMSFFQPALLEIHHSAKKDKPSGTAKRFSEIMDIRDVFSIRAGDEPGIHTIYLLGEGESIEVTHRARSRRIFAMGAIAAARWIKGKERGLYSVEDIWNMKG